MINNLLLQGYVEGRLSCILRNQVMLCSLMLIMLDLRTYVHTCFISKLRNPYIKPKQLQLFFKKYFQG